MVSRNNIILALVAIFLFGSAGLAYLGNQGLLPLSHPGSITTIQSQNQSNSSGCSPPFSGQGNHILKSQLQNVTFGAVTKFQLPTTPERVPNAVTVAPDGSVWFGEESVPGVGHLYPNGTLVEYAWPFNYSFSPDSGYSCSSYKTDIWGIALWNGKVYASDVTGNQLVALDPHTGSVSALKLPLNNSFPYTMAVSPFHNNSLWFTDLSSRIGRVFSNGTVVQYPLTQDGKTELPAEITFVNSTLGYYVNVGGAAGSAKSSVYRFNPQQQQFSPQIVGGGSVTFFSPDSIAASGNNGLWIDEHGPSSVAFYNLTTNQATRYPTSSINYTNTVLPYFVESNNSLVWFNEHYGNKIARLDSNNGTLIEYAESNPPPINGSQIDNALTFALGKDKAWFTEWTANYVGFVNASYRPTFYTNLAGGSFPTIALWPGSSTNLTLQIEGKSSKPLSIQFSDSESFGAVPQNITMTSSTTKILALNDATTITLTIKAKPGLLPGNYVLLVTVSDGLILQSDYVRLSVIG